MWWDFERLGTMRLSIKGRNSKREASCFRGATGRYPAHNRYTIMTCVVV